MSQCRAIRWVLLGEVASVEGAGSGPAGRFVLFLIVWPSLLCLLPINHFLVQCVALRATVWFLPVLLIATRLTTADLAVFARGLAVLNLVALAGGIYVFENGVEALYQTTRSPRSSTDRRTWVVSSIIASRPRP